MAVTISEHCGSSTERKISRFITLVPAFKNGFFQSAESGLFASALFNDRDFDSGSLFETDLMAQ